jgi:tetratricopeptide (TPR) repeat protein
MAEARQLIRRVPEQTAADARAKYVAEAELLREAKQWAEADKVLAPANKAFPNDTDLLYEQAMVVEKLNHLEEMERLLRRVIELKPTHHHAYNALGYSLAERKLRLPEARKLIQKALELSPGEPFITDSLGWVEYRWGIARKRSDPAHRLPGAARPGDRGAPRRGAVDRGPDRGSAQDLARRPVARCAKRRAAGDAGPAAGRPVTGRGPGPRADRRSCR